MADAPPTHPGEVLRDEFLQRLKLSIGGLAHAMAVPQSRVRAIVQGKRAITPDTALRLARYFGTIPDFWIGLQMSYDLEMARQRNGAQINLCSCPGSR